MIKENVMSIAYLKKDKDIEHDRCLSALKRKFYLSTKGFDFPVIETIIMSEEGLEDITVLKIKY
jgi:hypothetical protein